MTDTERDARREAIFSRARRGDRDAFGDWAAMVETQLRRSVQRFARFADIEVVVQETLLRMWILATDPDRPLDGPAASLRFALRVARNVAFEEIRRNHAGRREDLEVLESLPEGRTEPDPSPDPALRRAISDCIERLPDKPRQSLLSRLNEGHECPDRDLAARLSMKLNTFLQNIVRARHFLKDCLSRHGVSLEEVAP